MRTDTPAIRPIDEADWPVVAGLEDEAYPAGLAEGEEGLRSWVAVSPETSFVLTIGGRIAGYVISFPHDGEGVPSLDSPRTGPVSSARLHLHDLVIAEEWRGRGLGPLLADHLHRVAAAGGFERMSLVALSGRHAFWRRQGYRHRAGWAVPSCYGPSALPMERGLAGVPALQPPRAVERV